MQSCQDWVDPLALHLGLEEPTLVPWVGDPEGVQYDRKTR